MTTICCGKVTLHADPDPKATTAGKVGKWLAIACVIGGLLFGVSGLLVYINQMQLGLNGIMLSATNGFYTMIGGFTAVALVLVLGGISLASSRCALTENMKRPD